jgi:hypothetical protein
MFVLVDESVEDSSTVDGGVEDSSTPIFSCCTRVSDSLFASVDGVDVFSDISDSSTLTSTASVSGSRFRG